MREGLGGGKGKDYPRAGEEQKEKLEEMLRLRLLSPLPPPLNPRRRQGGCKVKAGTLSLSLRATQSQTSEMQEKEVAAAEEVVVKEEEEEEEKEAKEEEKGKREMR